MPSEDNCPLRRALINTDDDYVSSCLAITLTKLAIKAKKNLSSRYNQLAVDSILIICALLKGHGKKRYDPDSKQRMQLCLRVLSNPHGLQSLTSVETVLVDQGKKVFAKFLESHSKLAQIHGAATLRKNGRRGEEALLITQPDEGLVFRQLKGRTGATDFDITEELSGDGNTAGAEDFLGDIRKEIDAKIYQLTGYSDPIYAEAFVEVHHYDILLKILVVNRTNKTLPNVTLELLTQGNLKLVEKPLTISGLRALSSQTLKASLKVNSTDNGAIYGYLTYDSASGNIPNIVNLNEIQIDFINELQPADCSELDFKKKWADYEWENKVQINTPATDLRTYVDYFAKCLNVKVMTPITDQDEASGFLVCNLYTKSKFEEDCLLNMSIEKVVNGGEGGRITGLIRVRAKTEGMALCIGDKCKTVK